MIDRRAIVVGSWLAKGRDKPSGQKVKSLTRRWGKLFGQQKYRFSSLLNRRRAPDILHNPNRTELTEHFENAGQVTNDTELFLYFLGHSTSFGTDDIQLILGLNEAGEERTCTLKWLLSTIHEAAPNLKKLVLALDTCHAGRSIGTIQAAGFDYMAMFGTGSAYAFDAVFTEGLLRALELPLRKSDQRIDRQLGGVTYRKIFEDARRFVLSRDSSGTGQDPQFSGQYTGKLLLEAPVVTPEGYNEFASSRTIYGRLFSLLEKIVQSSGVTFNQLLRQVEQDEAFLVRRNGSRSAQFVSSQRLLEYIDFLRRAGWVIEPAGKLHATKDGQRSCDRRVWNRQLLKNIESEVFPEGVSLGLLDEIVSGLLSDMIPATPMKITERAKMKGFKLALDAPLRVALQVLPATGRFMKGAADAIYPSELGGEAPSPNRR